MDCLLSSQAERCRMEVYSEYLKKIPQLLKQLETVEIMYEKAKLEEEMLALRDPEEHSVALYARRLGSTREQCRLRAADIREQLRLIFALKAQVERESSALRTLMDTQKQED